MVTSDSRKKRRASMAWLSPCEIAKMIEVELGERVERNEYSMAEGEHNPLASELDQRQQDIHAGKMVGSILPISAQ